VVSVDIKGAMIELSEGVEGYLRASEILHDTTEDIIKILNIGDIIEAKYTNIDRKNRMITLSFCVKDEVGEKDTIVTLNKQENINFTNNTMAEAFKAAKSE
ncbi:MAG: S1 RNA-binding domain-containing protein, partial [Arsenophonus sp. ER-LPS3-MAG3]